MSKDDKVRMPSSMGGLVNYSDEFKSNIEIKPGTVIIFVIVVSILMILLNIYGKTMFGI